MSGETLGAVAGGDGKIIFNDKAPRGVKILVYSEGGVTSVAKWEDNSGIIGWCPMPSVDKAELEACLANPHSGFRKPRISPVTQPVPQGDSNDISQ